MNESSEGDRRALNIVPPGHRWHLDAGSEFGIVLAKGIQHALKLVEQLLDGKALSIPELAAKVVITLAEQLRALQARIADLEKDLVIWSRDDQVVKCLQTIPGIGIITASALAAFHFGRSSPSTPLLWDKMRVLPGPAPTSEAHMSTDHPSPRHGQADGRWSERQCLRTESVAGAGRREDVKNRILAARPAFAELYSAGVGRSDNGIRLNFAAKLSSDWGPPQ